jgi:hypothetical protein
LKDEHAEFHPVAVARRDIRQLEHRVSNLVNDAHGFTPEEGALMWKTVPPGTPDQLPTCLSSDGRHRAVAMDLARNRIRSRSSLEAEQVVGWASPIWGCQSCLARLGPAHSG